MDENRLPIRLLRSPLLVHILIFGCGNTLFADSPRQGLLNEGPAMLRRLFRQHSSACDAIPCDAGSCSIEETYPVVTREAPKHDDSSKQPTLNSIPDPPPLPEATQTPRRIPAPRVAEPIKKDRSDAPEVRPDDYRTDPFLDDQVRAAPFLRRPLGDAVIIKQVGYESRGSLRNGPDVPGPEDHPSQTESTTVVSAPPLDEDLFQVHQTGGREATSKTRPSTDSFIDRQPAVLSHESRWLSPVYVQQPRSR